MVAGKLVMVGTVWAWSSKVKALRGSWELPSKVTALPLRSSLPKPLAHGMRLLYPKIKFWIFTYLRVIGKKDVLVYPAITALDQLMASSYHLWTTQGWRSATFWGPPRAAPTSQARCFSSPLT